MHYLRIWHDNTGKGDYASWFLKFVIVLDLQTMEKYYFICNQWLAVEKGDGNIERHLSIATDVEKKNVKYLIVKQTKENLSDSHLLFSIFNRPAHSSFSRLERVVCLFFLLYMGMLINILFYGIKSLPSENSIVLGPFEIGSTSVYLCLFYILSIIK